MRLPNASFFLFTFILGNHSTMLQSVSSYFATISSAHRSMILASGLCFFWVVEWVLPLCHFSYHKTRHALLNIFFTLTTILVNFSLAWALVATSDWAVANRVGLVHWLGASVGITLLIGLPLLDLVGAYWVHSIEHRIKFLWKFHMVHHADTYVDVTTANRHHPGESLLRAGFTILATLLVGAPVWLVLLYQSMSVVATQFNHANIQLPQWLDRILGWVLVTPNMHRVHHHAFRPHTDSNYGNIFSFWDRLFGTYQHMPVENIEYGLDVLDKTKHNDFSYQLGLPFNRNIKTDY